MSDREFSRPDDSDNEPFVEDGEEWGSFDAAPSSDYIQPVELVIVHEQTKSVDIRLRPSQVAPDRTQYKPYSPVYEFPYGVFVQVTVPFKFVEEIGKDKKSVVLTTDGIAFVADELATALDKMHDSFRSRPRNF